MARRRWRAEHAGGELPWQTPAAPETRSIFADAGIRRAAFAAPSDRMPATPRLRNRFTRNLLHAQSPSPAIGASPMRPQSTFPRSANAADRRHPRRPSSSPLQLPEVLAMRKTATFRPCAGMTRIRFEGFFSVPFALAPWRVLLVGSAVKRKTDEMRVARAVVQWRQAGRPSEQQ